MRNSHRLHAMECVAESFFERCQQGSHQTLHEFGEGHSGKPFTEKHSCARFISQCGPGCGIQIIAGSSTIGLYGACVVSSKEKCMRNARHNGWIEACRP